METANARFTLDRTEYLRVLRIVLAGGPRRPKEVVFALGGWIGIGIWLIVERFAVFGWAVVVPGVGVALLGSTAYVRSARRWDETRDSVERAYQISDEEIVLTTSRGTSACDWSQFDKLTETNDFLVLGAKGSPRFITFAKRGFETSGDAEAFRSIAARHVKEPVKRWLDRPIT